MTEEELEQSVFPPGWHPVTPSETELLKWEERALKAEAEVLLLKSKLAQIKALLPS